MKALKIILSFIVSIILVFSACKKNNTNPDDIIFDPHSEVWEPTYEDLQAFYEDGFNIINSRVFIVDIDSIYDMTLLSNVKRINGSLFIYNNINLITLEGLNKLESLYGLHIGPKYTDQHVSNLIDINGLNNLKSIKGFLYITNNYHLTNIEGLEGLSNISNRCLIFGNTILNSLDGLNKLQSIEDEFVIYDNDSLTDFCAIKNATLVLEKKYLLQIQRNKYNPTADDIIVGNCSQ